MFQSLQVILTGTQDWEPLIRFLYFFCLVANVSFFGIWKETTEIRLFSFSQTLISLLTESTEIAKFIYSFDHTSKTFCWATVCLGRTLHNSMGCVHSVVYANGAPGVTQCATCPTVYSSQFEGPLCVMHWTKCLDYTGEQDDPVPAWWNFQLLGSREGSHTCDSWEVWVCWSRSSC